MNKLLTVIGLLALTVLISCEDETIQLTKSGYEYVTCVDLEGNPGAGGDWVFIHATGLAKDSVLFDTRQDGDPTPIQLPTEGSPRGQLSPLQDVLALMSEGDSMRFEYPVDSFKAPAPPLGEDVTSITYVVKVYDIMTPTEFETWRDNEMKKTEERFTDVQAYVEGVYSQYKSNELNVQRTASGLGYIIHEQGTGPTPRQGQAVNAQYFGVLAENGEMFDNSYQRGRPFSFQLGMGMVIPGWDEGFAMLNNGSKATFFIPAELGYGAMGSPPVIPADAELIFYVELEGIR